MNSVTATIRKIDGVEYYCVHDLPGFATSVKDLISLLGSDRVFYWLAAIAGVTIRKIKVEGKHQEIRVISQKDLINLAKCAKGLSERSPNA